MRAVPCERGEDGFILLESIVAISLISLLMGALATFTVNSLISTNEMRARQAAAQIATSAMGGMAALSASDLLAGRTSEATTAQYNSASTTVRAWLRSDPAGLPFDANATASSSPLVSTSPVTTVLNGITYRASTYIDRCFRTGGDVASCSATSTGSATETEQLRPVVAVTWSGSGCAGSGGVARTCTFLSASLVSRDPDPVFNASSGTPPRPAVNPPGDQRTTVGAAESLQLDTASGTGQRPHTWSLRSGTLPVGLTLDGNGAVLGTPTTVQAATPITVMVTDVYDRTAEATFTWTVVAAPTITTPPNQSSPAGQALTLTIASTCPNSPCTFAATGLPAGLSIDAATGNVSGTPTTVGTSSVVITITDADGVAASTRAFSWVVVGLPTITGVSPLLATVDMQTNDELPFTCPAGPCTVTVTSAVPGLGLSATNGRTDVNTTTSLTVTAASDSVWLSGTVAASAVPTGRSRTYPVSVTITSGDGSASSSATWTATTTTLVNYALTRAATQSSTDVGAAPARATDGNTSGVFANGSVTQTREEVTPWWQVDLGAGTAVRTVRLLNRTDACCAGRLANGVVFLSSTDMTGRTYAQLVADPAITELPFGSLDAASLALSGNDVRARFVRVQLAGTGVLNLAEVQVLGANLATGRPTAQSSLFEFGRPEKAVDGNTSGVYTDRSDAGSVTHTNQTSQPWWQVDLEAPAAIDAITVWNRTNCCSDRLTDAVLLFSNTPFGNRTYAALNSDASVTKIRFGTAETRIVVPVGITAQYVRVQLPGTGSQYLSLAEVQINGRLP